MAEPREPGGGETCCGRLRRAKGRLMRAPCIQCSPSLLEPTQGLFERASSSRARAAYTLLPKSVTSPMQCSTPGCERRRGSKFHTCCQTCRKSGGLVHGPKCNEFARRVEYYKGHRPFQVQCATVLHAMSHGKDWVVTWNLNGVAQEKMRKTWFKEIDVRDSGDSKDEQGPARGSTTSGPDGRISEKEFDAWCEKPEIVEELKSGCVRFRGLLYKETRQKAFQKFDKDGESGLSRREFEDFIYHIEREYLKWQVRRAHLSFRAYWARGELYDEAESASGQHLLELLQGSGGAHGTGAEGPGETGDDGDVEADTLIKTSPSRRVFLGLDSDVSAPKDDESDCRCLRRFTAPGWWDDFLYYSANNHPLHGIFMCDPHHPLDWQERLVMEISTLCYMYMSVYVLSETSETRSQPHLPGDVAPTGISSAAEQLEWIKQHKNDAGFVTNTLYVTLPGMVLWYVLFFLFTMPCANVNEASESPAAIARGRIARRVGEATGHLITLLGFAGLAMVMFYLQDSDKFKESLLLVARGRIKGYVIAWTHMVLVTFNPLVALGNTDPDQSSYTVLDMLCDSVALGQWRIEKMRFQNLCRRGLQRLNEQSRSRSSR